MAATEGVTGIGTTIIVGGVTIAEAFDVNSPEQSVAVVEFTHYNSDNDQVAKKPSGWKDIGDVTVSMNFTVAGYAALCELLGVENQNVEIHIGRSGGVHTFIGFVSKLGGNPLAIKDRIVEKVTLTVSSDYDFVTGGT